MFTDVFAWGQMYPNRPASRLYMGALAAMALGMVTYQMVYDGEPSRLFNQVSVFLLVRFLLAPLHLQGAVGIPWATVQLMCCSVYLFLFTTMADAMVLLWQSSGSGVADTDRPAISRYIERYVSLPVLLELLTCMMRLVVRLPIMQNARHTPRQNSWMLYQLMFLDLASRYLWMASFALADISNVGVASIISSLYSLCTKLTLPHRDFYPWRLLLGKRKAELLLATHSQRQLMGAESLITMVVNIVAVGQIAIIAPIMGIKDESYAVFPISARVMVLLVLVLATIGEIGTLARNLDIDIDALKLSKVPKLTLTSMAYVIAVQGGLFFVALQMPMLGCLDYYNQESGYISYRMLCVSYGSSYAA